MGSDAPRCWLGRKNSAHNKTAGLRRCRCANPYADAKSVNITVKDDEIVIEDDGVGMDIVDAKRKI